MHKRHFLAVAASVLVIGVAACSPAKVSFNNVDITGSTEFGKDFSLLDAQGKTRHLADFKGKVVVLFFGYTHCPDVCPTTLTEMSAVMNALGKDAERVQVIFITVDPERDTAALMGQYPSAFYPSFIGLRPADEAALKQVTKDFKVFYSKVPSKTAGSYTMDHTAGSYVFDPAGTLRLFIRHGQGADPIAQDLRALLH